MPNNLSSGGSPYDLSACDVSEATPEGTEGLANEALLILQPFRRHFTYVQSTSRTSPGEPPMNTFLLDVKIM